MVLMHLPYSLVDREDDAVRDADARHTATSIPESPDPDEGSNRSNSRSHPKH